MKTKIWTKIGIGNLMALAVLATFAAPLAHADDAAPTNTVHPKRHRRVRQVNHHIYKTEAEINRDQKDGKITSAQAAAARADLKNVKKEEIQDRAQDNGHLTKKDQKQLNQQTRAVQQQVNNDVNQNAPQPVQQGPAQAPAAGGGTSN